MIPRAAPSAELVESLRLLRNIANNMNQIARRINTGEWDSLDVVKIVSALGAVERELAELRALHK